jgi:hypothetical protein
MNAPAQARLTQKPARRKGQALVEFGLVIMLFVLLVSGVFDFGMLINTRLSVSSMSRTLARDAASGTDPSVIAQLAQQGQMTVTEQFGPLVGGQFTVRLGKSLPGDYVRIEVTGHGQVITPMVRPFFGCSGAQSQCSVQMADETIMRLEPDAVGQTAP